MTLPDAPSRQRDDGGTKRWLIVVAATALAVGLGLRFEGLERKPWWADELATWTVLSGCTNADLETLLDGGPHRAGDLLACQRVSPGRDTGDVLRALLDEGPQNLPLYFLLARELTRLLDREWAPRLVSAIASALALAAGAALGRELFGSWLAGALTAALAAVSPLQLRFALEARDYALWSLFTALSAWLLLRARRTNEVSAWMLFGAAQAVSLQTHLLSLPASAALLAWALFTSDAPRLAHNSPARRHLVAFAMAAAPLLPWCVATALHHTTVQQTLSWSARAMPGPQLARRWFGTVTQIFVRTGADGGLVGPGTDWRSKAARLAIGGAVALLLLACAARLVRTEPRAVWSFVAMLGLPLFLALALPDLLFGGQRSIMARYFLPAWWAADLLVAGAIAGWIRSDEPPRVRRRAVLAGTALLALGLASSVRCAAQPVWWDTDPSTLRVLMDEAARARENSASRAPGSTAGEAYWMKDVRPYEVMGFARLLPADTVLVLGALPPARGARPCFQFGLFGGKVSRCRWPAG